MRDRVREPFGAELGEVVARRDAELRAHRLDQHRHQVRDEDDPEQQVAVLRARGDVGREVARIDVRDRRDEGRAQERPQPAQAAPPLGQRAVRRLEHALLAGERNGRQVRSNRRVQGLPSMRMRSASSREMRVALACDLDRERAVERSVADHDDALVRHESELREIPQELGIAVRHAPDHALLAAREIAQRAIVLVHELELGRRDRVAVRVAGRMAERSVDARLERLREVVLEALGLGVHLVPGQPEGLHQVELEQAVVADHLERGLCPGLRERDAVVRLVPHEPDAREPLDHRRRRRGGHAEPLRERARADAARAIEHPDRLQVVLNGLGHDQHEIDIRRL